MTQKKELELLRSYFKASELSKAIGKDEAMQDSTYGLKVAEINQQKHNMNRIASQLPNLTRFIKYYF